MWYTIDGRRVSGKPTQKGLYIVNGKFNQNTLTYSHDKPQTLIYRAFEAREGERKSLTLPSHFGSHSLTLHSDYK